MGADDVDERRVVGEVGDAQNDMGGLYDMEVCDVLLCDVLQQCCG